MVAWHEVPGKVVIVNPSHRVRSEKFTPGPRFEKHIF
jgi:hypothetical protein